MADPADMIPSPQHRSPVRGREPDTLMRIEITAPGGLTQDSIDIINPDGTRTRIALTQDRPGHYVGTVPRG